MTREGYYHRRNSCTRKVAYVSWEAAERACLSMHDRRDYEPRQGGLLAYRCLYGDHWHIGNASNRARHKALRARALLVAQ